MSKPERLSNHDQSAVVARPEDGLTVIWHSPLRPRFAGEEGKTLMEKLLLGLMLAVPLAGCGVDMQETAYRRERGHEEGEGWSGGAEECR